MGGRIWLLIGLLVLLSGCGGVTIGTSDGRSFSFENDLEGWSANGTDLNNPPIVWSVGRSEELSREGVASVRLHLNNLNDAGKIWIERPFTVAPNRSYEVEVRYAFATRDYGDVNLFTLITGVLPRRPRTRDDLNYVGDTGNGASGDVGFVWQEKSYRFTATSNAGGALYVSIGVWGTWEGPRTYYLDRVRVTLTEQ